MHSIERHAEMMQIEDDETWCQTLFRIGNSLGFDRILLAILPRPDMRLVEAFVRSCYKPEWRDHYDVNEFAFIDPTVAHCAANNRPLVWSPEIFVTGDQKQMYEEALRFGMRSGVTLPIHGARGERGMICFANDARPGIAFNRDVAHLLPELTLLRDIVFDASARFLRPEQQELPQLTKRELECLKWVAAGKSTWEIACILRCSEAVVNFHMANVRRKFGVSSRHEAALKAVRLGLVTL